MRLGLTSLHLRPKHVNSSIQTSNQDTSNSNSAKNSSFQTPPNMTCNSWSQQPFFVTLFEERFQKTLLLQTICRKHFKIKKRIRHYSGFLHPANHRSAASDNALHKHSVKPEAKILTATRQRSEAVPFHHLTQSA